MLAVISSDPPRPVGPVHPTGRTGRHHAADSTGQTGPTDRSDRSAQDRKAAHSALKCTTQQCPNLRVSLQQLPPLCIPADELDATGAEVDVHVSWNNNRGNETPSILILSKTYPTSGYNLAHIPRHARHLAGGYFAEKRLSNSLFSWFFAPNSYINYL